MASSSNNNQFAILSGLKLPSGKYVLEHVSSGDKNAATGSNAISIAPGNNKYAAALKSKVSTEPTLRRRPALILGTKKLPPNIRATSASCPGPSSPRKTSKLSPQAKSYVLPSKGLSHRYSLKRLKPVLPTGGTNFLPSVLTNSFGPHRTKRWTPVHLNHFLALPPKA